MLSGAGQLPERLCANIVQVAHREIPVLCGNSSLVNRQRKNNILYVLCAQSSEAIEQLSASIVLQ